MLSNPRLVSTVLAAALAIAGFLLLETSVAAASTSPPLAGADDVPAAPIVAIAAPTEQGQEVGGREVIDVVQVSGLIDRVVLDDLHQRLDAVAAAPDDVLALVLQLDTDGAVVSDEALDDLVEAVASSPVPIGAWIGPSGSSALGRSARLVGAADWSAISEGSRIGDLGAAAAEGDPLGPGSVEVRDRSVGRAEARQLELVDSSQSTLGDFVLSMMDAGVVTERVEQIDGPDGLVQQTPSVPVRFNKLPLVDQLFHTMASPSIAYLLLVAGLGLVLLEFFTGGVGIAGVTGALCVLGAGYGLAELPTTTWALVALVGSFLAFAVDVQTGVPRFWSGVGALMLIVGSLWLFPGPDASWITFGSGIVGVLLLMFTAMPNLVRTRFGTSTIGREWMLAEIGQAVSDVDPDGTVRVHDAQWGARTNRATPIHAGERLRVVGIDGPVLEVEPLEGAARDHRERARRSTTADDVGPERIDP